MTAGTNVGAALQHRRRHQRQQPAVRRHRRAQPRGRARQSRLRVRRRGHLCAPAPRQRDAISDRAARSGSAVARSGVRRSVHGPDSGRPGAGNRRRRARRPAQLHPAAAKHRALSNARHRLARARTAPAEGRRRLQPRRQPRREPAAELRRAVLLRRALTARWPLRSDCRGAGQRRFRRSRSGCPSRTCRDYGDPFGTNRFFDAAMFVQDEWRPKDTLTLRLGVRYQKQFWDEDIGSGNLDIGPRVAMSWDPVGNGRTSIAAAYGLFFDSQFNAPISAARIANGESAPRRGVPGCARRSGVAIAGTPPAAGRARERAEPLARGRRRPSTCPYTHQYSVTRQSSARIRSVVSSVSGIATKGNRYVSSIDYNPLVPSLGPGRRPADVNSVAGTSASQLQYTPWGESWYRGLLRVGDQASVARIAGDGVVHAVEGRRQHQRFHQQPSAGSGTRARSAGPGRAAARIRSVSGARAVAAGSAAPVRRDGRAGAAVRASGRPASSRPGPGRPYNIIAGADLNGDGDATVSPGPDRARTVPSDPSTSIGRNTGRLPREHRLDARVTKRLRAGPRSTRQPHARRAERASTRRTSRTSTACSAPAPIRRRRSRPSASSPRPARRGSCKSARASPTDTLRSHHTWPTTHGRHDHSAQRPADGRAHHPRARRRLGGHRRDSAAVPSVAEAMGARAAAGRGTRPSRHGRSRAGRRDERHRAARHVRAAARRRDAGLPAAVGDQPDSRRDAALRPAPRLGRASRSI